MNRDYGQNEPKNTKTEKPIRVMQVVGRMMGGGVEAMVMNYYRHIDRSKVQFDFVIQSDSTVVPREEIESLGGRIFVVPPYSNPFAYMKACRQLFEEQNPVIVHSHMNTISVFTLRAAKQAGVPVRIAHSHSTANPKERAKTLVKNMLRPFSRVYPTHLAACSKTAARWLFGQRVVDNNDVHYINNAIDLAEFVYSKKTRRQLREEIGAGEKTIVIGQVGRLCFQKNQRFTIDVFSAFHARYPESLLVLLGDGDEKEYLQLYAKKKNVGQCVSFLGARDDVASWYSAFDVLMFPSTYEGLGMAAIEAQAEGLPVLASDRVPVEVDIVPGSIHHVPLSSGVSVWSKYLTKIVMRQLNVKHASQSDLLSAAGYDITQSAIELAKWYRRLFITSSVVGGCVR